mgnify:FL=1
MMRVGYTFRARRIGGFLSPGGEMGRTRIGAALCAAALVTLLAAPAVRAQDGPHFRFGFGWQDMSGDMGDVMDGAVDAEFSIIHPVKQVRIGAGANWVSFAMDDFDESWNQIRLHLLVGYPFRVSERFVPYIEGRWVYRRMRPEDDRFYGGEEELLRDFVVSGSGFEGVIGTEFVLNRASAIDFAIAANPFSVSPDLSDEGLGEIDSGMAWRVHVGLSWFPTNGR